MTIYYEVKQMVEQSELTEIISTMDDYFETVADVQKVEVDEVKELFNQALTNAIELDPDKSANFIILRAKANLDNIFDNRQSSGDTYVFIPFGPVGNIQDVNGPTLVALRERFAGGNLATMITNGKVMTMKVPVVADGEETGEYELVPVSKVLESTTILKWFKDGAVHDEEVEGGIEFKEVIVTKGIQWKRGLPLAYRDYRMTNRWGSFNYGYTKELRPFWETILSGIAYPSQSVDDWRMFEIRVRYDQADPNSEDFIFNRFKPFKAYKGNFECWDEKPWVYKLKSYGPVKALATDLQIEAMDTHISKILTELRNEFGDLAESEKGFIPPFIFLPDMKAYHESTAMRDETGAIITKGEKLYDKTRWNAYAVLSVYVRGMDDKRGLRYILKDASVRRSVYTYTAKYMKTQEFKLPASCLCTVRTSRNANRYDWEEPDKTNRLKFEPGNGDINITINSISPIIELEKPTIQIDTNLM
jgi:hypothetical protein